VNESNIIILHLS
jgi:hypothetical protein